MILEDESDKEHGSDEGKHPDEGKGSGDKPDDKTNPTP